jgi:hypothetical protein
LGFPAKKKTAFGLVGSGGIALTFITLTLGSFILLILYPQGKSLWYSLERRLSLFHSWSGH